MSNLKNKIMESIQNEEIKMRSRLFFVVIKALSEIGLVVLALIVIFLINLSFYLPRRALGSGLKIRHWLHVIQVIPWGIVLAGVIGLALLTWIIRRYTGAYKKNLILIIALVSIISLVIGFVLSISNFNERLENRVKEFRGKGAGQHRQQMKK